MSIANTDAEPTEPAASSTNLSPELSPLLTQAETAIPSISPALNAVAQLGLAPVTLGYAFFHFFLAATYLVFWPRVMVTTIVPLVAGTAVVLLALYGLLRYRPVPPDWARRRLQACATARRASTPIRCAR